MISEAKVAETLYGERWVEEVVKKHTGEARPAPRFIGPGKPKAGPRRFGPDEIAAAKAMHQAGKTRAEIAEALGVGVATVANYRHLIMPDEYRSRDAGRRRARPAPPQVAPPDPPRPAARVAQAAPPPVAPAVPTRHESIRPNPPPAASVIEASVPASKQRLGAAMVRQRKAAGEIARALGISEAAARELARQIRGGEG